MLYKSLSVLKKVRMLKLQQPQNDQMLFPEIATTLQIENLENATPKKEQRF